jgi:hypothetical protein
MISILPMAQTYKRIWKEITKTELTELPCWNQITVAWMLDGLVVQREVIKIPGCGIAIPSAEIRLPAYAEHGFKAALPTEWIYDDQNRVTIYSESNPFE